MSDNKSSADKLKCPNCGELIPISEALRRQVGEEARASLQKELAPREQAITAKEEQLAQKEASLKTEALTLEVMCPRSLFQSQCKFSVDVQRG